MTTAKNVLSSIFTGLSKSQLRVGQCALPLFFGVEVPL